MRPQGPGRPHATGPEEATAIRPAQGARLPGRRGDVALSRGKTTVVLGLILTNIHTAQVTAEVELVSTTSSRGGANNVANGTSFLAKNVPIPVGSSLELLTGSKVVLEAGDVIQVDCSVADKLSGTLSIMEIT